MGVRPLIIAVIEHTSCFSIVKPLLHLPLGVGFQDQNYPSWFLLSLLSIIRLEYVHNL